MCVSEPGLWKQIAEDCMSEEELRAASLAVIVPVFGTLDSFQAELRRWRRRRT